LIINGNEKNYEKAITILEMLADNDLKETMVVVEVNGIIIAKEKFATHILDNRDIIEIVGFVGGG